MVRPDPGRSIFLTPKQQLHSYLSEFDFRYSNRKVSDTERAAAALKGIEGKRLMYRSTNQTQNA